MPQLFASPQKNSELMCTYEHKISNLSLSGIFSIYIQNPPKATLILSLHLLLCPPATTNIKHHKIFVRFIILHRIPYTTPQTSSRPLPAAYSAYTPCPAPASSRRRSSGIRPPAASAKTPSPPPSRKPSPTPQ